MPTTETASQYEEQEQGQGRAHGRGDWSGRDSERVTRAGRRSILGGQGKEFRVQQTRLLCQSRGTGSTRPGSGSASGSSVAQRNESEAQRSIRLSDEPVEGGIHGRDGQGGAATDPVMGDGEAGAPGHSVRRTGLSAGRAAGSVPRQSRGLARGRTRRRASGDRTRGGRGRLARRWARWCHASRRGPVGQVQLGRHETEVAQLQLVVNASLDRLSDVSGRKELRGTRGVV